MRDSLSTLVIGGVGFIGYHLVSELVKSGRKVTVLDRKVPSDSVLGVVYKTGNFANAELIESLVLESDEIIHLAYATHPNTSFDNPFSDLSENIPPTLRLFDLAARYGVKVLFVSSGGTVYGEAASTPVAETHPTQPISPYGVTKLTLEKYAFLYAITKGLQVVCVRPSNPYGEGQKPFTGQGFVATAIATALQHKPITIFGKQGTIRDYLYIDDVASGIVTALDKGENSEVYNIGSTTGMSNAQLLDTFRPLLKECGIILQIQHAPERPFDVKVNILDCTKLQQLGWKPQVSVTEGAQRTLRWLQSFMKNKPIINE